MEQTIDSIIKWGEFITALGIISGFCWKLLKSVKQLLAEIEVIKKHTKENYLCELRLTIMSEEMPIEERLEAGEKYVNLGGNGAVKCKYRQLQQAYEAELERGRGL